MSKEHAYDHYGGMYGEHHKGQHMDHKKYYEEPQKVPEHHYGKKPVEYDHHYAMPPKKDEKAHKKELHTHCQKHQLYFVQCQLFDGSMVEGIIDKYDEDSVTLLTPCGDDYRDFYEDERQLGGFGGVGGFVGYGGTPGGFGHYGPGHHYGGYGHGYGHHGYPHRFRRFRRTRYPFSNIFRFLTPFFF